VALAVDVRALREDIVTAKVRRNRSCCGCASRDAAFFNVKVSFVTRHGLLFTSFVEWSCVGVGRVHANEIVVAFDELAVVSAHGEVTREWWRCPQHW
jgi:hypothetical protein